VLRRPDNKAAIRASYQSTNQSIKTYLCSVTSANESETRNGKDYS